MQKQHLKRVRRILVGHSLVIVLAILMIVAIPVGAQRTKLTIMMPGTTIGVYPEGVIEGFQELYPEIELEIIGGGWGENLNKIPVMAASGTLPDLWYGEAGRAAEWGYQGFVQDLKPFIDRDLDLDDFFLLEASSDPQGRVWGIPGGFQMAALFYLINLFDAAGVAYPDDGWTVDDMIDAAKKLTRRDGNQVTQYGLYTPTGASTGWLVWTYLMGGRIMDETLTQSMMNTPETIEATDFIRRLMWEEEVSPKFGVESGYSFQNGNLAMSVNQFINNHTLQEAGIYTYDVAKVPAAPDGRRNTTVVPNVWMMAKDSPAQEAAWTFLKYYISPDVQEKVVAKGSEVPVSRHVGPSFLSIPPPPQNRHVFLESFEFARTLDENAAWTDWFYSIHQELYPAFRNQEPTAVAAARAHQRLQSILDEVYK